MKQTTAFITLLGLFHFSYAQQTRVITDPQATFKQAKEYYQREQYSLAYPLLKDLQLQQNSADRSNQAITYQEIKYYTIVCALKQNEEGAVLQARKFIELEDNAARVQMMNFHLAEYFFRKQDYAQAASLYQNVKIGNLSNREIADMKFHLGYGYFIAKQFDKAKPMFDAIRQMKDDPNYADANYYYGFICFYEKKYREALDAFTIVEDHPNYGKVVPFYIAGIYYSLGQKDKALEYAEAKLKRGNLYYEAQMRQIVGHAYFEKKQFSKALPYLESYVSKADSVKREDIYELSYAYYDAKNWNKAIDGFKQISGKEDSLAQNAMYLLGDSYLKTGQKANARNAFLMCARNSSNQKQQEVSQFNYAKLSYELGYQDVALSELQEFLTKYPQSDYNNEAKELLVNMLASTNNYKDALTLLESVKSPSPNARRLYPVVLYGRATELINDGMLVGAGELLTKAEGEIIRALNEESRDTNIIIITGGLGPTADDITKPVLCEYFGGKLVVNEDVLKHLMYLFEHVFRRPVIERNLKQAEVPDVCTVLPNARGTAPGMWFEKEGKVFVSLPGVPHEMKGLITTEVLPRLQQTFTMPFIAHRTLLTAGVGESFIAEKIMTWEERLPAHLKLAYLPNYGMVRLRITGWSANKEQLENELNTEFAQLKILVQEWLVTDEDNTLPMALSKLLRAKNKTMATAESCTGGYIAHLITAISGASNIYKGSIISYDNEIKINALGVSPATLQKMGAVSEEVVKEMAAGALAKMNTDYALAVSGIMGPDGGSPEKPVGTVWVAAGDRNKLVTQKFLFRFDRDRNIEMTATQALNLLRKFIVEHA